MGYATMRQLPLDLQRKGFFRRWTADEIATGYCVVIGVLYLLLRAHTPLTVYAGAPHDDTLFMDLGASIADGRWLGPYNQFTLMKGPGFPLFLAVNRWLGLPLSLSTAMFHCIAVAAFTAASRRFIGSAALTALLFTLLLWHPLALSLFLLRVYRESIYYAQILLFLALAIVALFHPLGRRRRLGYAALAGLVLGWTWLTREEGVWVVPGVAVLVAAGGLVAYRARGLRTFALALAVAATAFLATQTLFRTVNLVVYKSFVGVDFKETNFQRALGALHSVRSGGIQPFVSITRAARARVYEVSPSFASLRDYLDGPAGRGWAKTSCEAMDYRTSCDEMGAGHFMFALRDAAASQRHYGSPAAASEFFGRVADEIIAACDRGALECVNQPVTEMPPMTWDVVKAGLRSSLFFDAAWMLLLVDPPRYVNGSSAEGAALQRRLRFLNNPPYEPQGGSGAASYELSGWYYKTGREWIWVDVRGAGGDPVPVAFERRGSPDLVVAFKAPDAAQQRYLLRTRCGDCTLVIETADGLKVEKKLADIKSGSQIAVGNGIFYVDSAEAQLDSANTDLAARASTAVRGFVLATYQWVWLPVLLLGALSWLAVLVAGGISGVTNVCFVIATVSWLLAATRMTLILGMAVTWTSPVILTQYYCSPAYFHLVCGAVLSIAACLQVYRRLRVTSTSPGPTVAR